MNNPQSKCNDGSEHEFEYSFKNNYIPSFQQNCDLKICKKCHLYYYIPVEVYFDGTHLMSYNLNRLHEFAQAIGLKRSWFQHENKKGSVPHYDIISKRLADLAWKKGAIKPDNKKLLELIRYWKKRNGKDLS